MTLQQDTLKIRIPPPKGNQSKIRAQAHQFLALRKAWPLKELVAAIQQAQGQNNISNIYRRIRSLAGKDWEIRRVANCLWVTDINAVDEAATKSKVVLDGLIDPSEGKFKLRILGTPPTIPTEPTPCKIMYYVSTITAPKPDETDSNA